MSKLHSTCPNGHFDEELFFEKILLSLSDSDSWIFSPSLCFFRRVCQNCLIGVQRISLWNRIFWKRTSFVLSFSFLAMDRNGVGVLPFFSVELSKHHSTCPNERFDGENFFWKKYLFYHFQTVSDEFSGLSGLSPAGLSVCIFNLSMGKIRRNLFFNKKTLFFFCRFWTKCKTFSAFLKSFLQCRPTSYLSFHVNICGNKNLFEREQYVLSFLDFEQKKVPTPAEKHRPGCQKCIIGVQRKSLRIGISEGEHPFFLLSLAFKRIGFGLLSFFFRWGCQHFILRVQMNVLMEKFF